MPNPPNLLPVVEKYIDSDVVAAARVFETMPSEEVADVLNALPPATSARVVRQLQVSYAAAVLKDAEPSKFVEIAEGLEPSHAATIFMHLPEPTRERVVDALPDRLRRLIQEQLTYPEGSVGRMMTTQFLAFRVDMTVRDAVEKIRLMEQRRFPASYGYVVDDQERLKGVMNMRDLLLAMPDQRLGSVMRTEVFAFHSFTDREEAAAQLGRRRYFAAPVVDSDGRMLGMIKAEQLIQGVREEMTEDWQRMFGAGGDERISSPITYSLKKRLPWLHVNLATAFLAAGVVALFESVIAKVTVLAVFLPVVAGQGGNAGAQSLAIVMRGLVMREIHGTRVRQVVLKESVIGIVSGIIIGLVTGAIAWIWNGNPWLGVVIALAMLVNLLAAGFSGAAIPILMKGMGLDPAQCSNIILTTVTDVIGFLAFLGFAVVFQSHLL
jgi:magnesium transporter